MPSLLGLPNPTMANPGSGEGVYDLPISDKFLLAFGRFF
jgi:hypothetical protein